MAVYLKADNVKNCKGVTVNEYFLTKHNPNKISMPSMGMNNIIGVTVHNTDWINVNSETTPAEQYTRATYNNAMGSVRVHYYVDNKCAWQNLPHNSESWHCGQSGKPHQYGSAKGNTNTISIECIMKSKDLSMTENVKSRDNCARLVAYLLFSYKLTIDNLYTHNYWVNIRNGRKGTTDYLNLTNDGYKSCPIYIRPQWNDFKALVLKYLNELKGNKNDVNVNTTSTETSAKFTPYLVKVVSKDGYVNIRKTPNWNDSDIVGKIETSNIKYTIINETIYDGTKFGKLKSGIGWISLNPNYAQKV